MRVFWILIGILLAAGAVKQAVAQPPEPAGQLVREVVFNELHDHDTHGFWRYWIVKHTQHATQLEQQVETSDGPVTRLLETNGRPLDSRGEQEERARLDRLVNSTRERASHRQAYIDDENHIARVFGLLPLAYVFEYVDDENGCHHLRYRPSPSYVPRTIEQRIVHSMSGDLWIDAQLKRLSRLDGHFDDNVDFGFGLLGRIDKGGWFRTQRVQVGATEWKMQSMEVHMSGRAILFKSIAHDTGEVRGGFAAVPAGLNLAQGMRILEQTDPHTAPNTLARISPVSLPTRP